MPGYFYKIRIVLKNCKKSFENVLNHTMWNSLYTQKRITSASIKTLQIKRLPLSTTK